MVRIAPGAVLGLVLALAVPAGGGSGLPARADAAPGARRGSPAPLTAPPTTTITIELHDFRPMAASRVTADLRLDGTGHGRFIVSGEASLSGGMAGIYPAGPVGYAPPDTSACVYPPEAWAELLRAAEEAGFLDGRAERLARAVAQARQDSLDLHPHYMGERPLEQRATIRVTLPDTVRTVDLIVDKRCSPASLLEFYRKLVEFADYCDPGRGRLQ